MVTCGGTANAMGLPNNLQSTVKHKDSQLQTHFHHPIADELWKLPFLSEKEMAMVDLYQILDEAHTPLYLFVRL
jgi:hypothetical protein